MNSNSGKSVIHSFSGGMNMDVDKSLLKENQYRYAENIRTTTNDGASTGAATNIEGSSIIDGLDIPVGDKIIAVSTVRDIGVVITSADMAKEEGSYTLEADINNETGSISAEAIMGEEYFFELSRTTPAQRSLDKNNFHLNIDSVNRTIKGQFHDKLTFQSEVLDRTVVVTIGVQYEFGDYTEYSYAFDEESTSYIEDSTADTPMLYYDSSITRVEVVKFSKENNGLPCDKDGIYSVVEPQIILPDHRYIGATMYYYDLYSGHVSGPTTFTPPDVVTGEYRTDTIQAAINGIDITRFESYDSIISGSTKLHCPNHGIVNDELRYVSISSSLGNYGSAGPTYTLNRIDGDSFWVSMKYVPVMVSYSGHISSFSTYDGIDPLNTHCTVSNTIPPGTIASVTIVSEFATYDGTFDISNINVAGFNIKNGGFIDNSLNRVNKIYRIEFDSDGSILSFTNVLKSIGVNFKIPEGANISIVSRYEDYDNIKVYWADGFNLIRVINIAPSLDVFNRTISNPNFFDIVPSADLKQPSIDSIGSGRLNSGIIEYYYQFCNKSGSETMLSQASQSVVLTSSNIQSESIKYFGTAIGEIYGKPSGKSVTVKIDIPSINKFTDVKLISVYYHNYSDAPVITVVKQIKIDENITGDHVRIEDGGVSAIGELTVAEFNLIGGNLFAPNYIESKDNILFAANTKENTFDTVYENGTEIYDTRSYQFKNTFSYGVPAGSYDVSFAIGDNNVGYLYRSVVNTTGSQLSDIIRPGDMAVFSGDYGSLYVSSISGNVITFSGDTYAPFGSTVHILGRSVSPMTLLLSSSGESTLYSSSALGSVPQSHDSIHEEIYKKERYVDLEYKYNKDGIYGGSGINVDYIFTNTYFIESYGNYQGVTPGVGVPDTEAKKLIDKRIARIGDVKRNNISSLIMKHSDHSSNTLDLSEFKLPVHSGPINYANPYLANTFKSYQRDEIYRFAAVFYDEKGRKSPAKWIADIRFPAGYISDNKAASSWDSSIFEMPSEYLNSAYNNTIYKDQELLVKPLGITFTFRNLGIIPSVRKIEIVRAKRDINNKTIYAQGVIQKTGKHRDKVDLLKPHPIISMAHNYSIRSPWYDNLYSANNIEFQWASDTVNDVKDFRRYEYSPARYNRKFLMFINPETSYYGYDFSEQIRNVSIDPIIDIVDCVFPVTTRPTKLDWGTYIGQDAHSQLKFVSTGTYPSALYAAADLHKYNIPEDSDTTTHDSSFFSIGLVGSGQNEIKGLDSTYKYNYSPTYNDETFEIHGTGSGVTQPGVKAYISLGGIASNSDSVSAYRYKSGFDGWVEDGDNSIPPTFIDKVMENKLNAATFKYYNRFSRPYGSTNNLSLILQLSNIVTDISKVNLLNLETLSTQHDSIPLSYKISGFEYSGLLKNSETIVNTAPSNYVSIEGFQFINYNSPYMENMTYESSSKNAVTMKGQASGQHGDGLIFKLDEDVKFPSIEKIRYEKNEYVTYPDIASKYRNLDDIVSTSLSTFVINLKIMNEAIYGGASIQDRQFTEYISTGSVIDVDSSSKVKTVFGGDTFIGIFDYTINRYTDPNVNKTDDANYIYPSNTHNEDGSGSVILNQRKYIGALIPLESSINLHLVNSKSYVASGYNQLIDPEAGVYGPAITSGSTYTRSQDTPQYRYNAVYSSEKTAIGYLSKLIGSESNKTFDCRAWSSEPKTNDELYDSWSKFKVANYIDVDTQFGQITGLKKFNNKLFFFQENAFGVLSVNERSLITDNNISSLTLGTGGILSRFDYISTSNGKKFGTIGNVVNSESALYWYDHSRAELCSFTNQLMPLSKAKGIQTLLNNNKSNIEDMVPMVFDKKYNEIQITLTGLGSATNIE